MEKDVSLAPMHPFIQGFALAIIQTLRNRKFGTEAKVIIDADMVPRISDKVMRASLGMRTLTPEIEEESVRNFERRDMSELIAPIRAPVQSVVPAGMTASVMPEVEKPKVLPAPAKVPIRLPPMPSRSNVPPIRDVPSMPGSAPSLEAPSISSGGIVDAEEKYGKIAPLLNDPSVSTIECLSAGKELMIIRAGQKQRTRIVLNAAEIKEILGKVADEAHIPLMEGVFRATITGFSINAVISEMVGSRFVIKKATAYGLLE